MLILLHSGQTGVERGAQRAAGAIGLHIAGFCTSDQRDELGRLPVQVARDLTPCLDRGPRAAVEANLAIASVVLVIVPSVRKLTTLTGMVEIVRSARARCLPHAVVDPTTDRANLMSWISGLPETSGSMRVFVTGPRATRWGDGERLSWQIVANFEDRLRSAAAG